MRTLDPTRFTSRSSDTEERPYTESDRRGEAERRRLSEGRSIAALRAVLAMGCQAHDAPASVPCWDIDSPLGALRMGLCGSRIRAAGFTGTVTTRRRGDLNADGEPMTTNSPLPSTATSADHRPRRARTRSQAAEREHPTNDPPGAQIAAQSREGAGA